MTEDLPAAKPEKTTAPGSAAGRWYLGILGFSIALIGLLFFGLMARSYLRAREMRTWPSAPCVILTSELEERQHDENSAREYRHNLSYGYEWQGKAHTGDHLTLRGNPWSSKRGLAEDRVKLYPVGMNTTCLIDPKNPDFSVLKPDSLAPGYSIWFPALFIIGGFGITLRAAIGTKSSPRIRPA